MISVSLALVAAFVWMPKWWRVAQREHYLVGSVSSTFWCWLLVTAKPNMILFPIGCIIALSSIVFNNEPTFWLTLVTAVTVAIATIIPVGLPFRGKTSKLRFTRRMKTCAFITAILWGTVLWWLTILLPSNSAAAIASMFGFLAVDAALLLAKPLETYFAKRHQNRAERHLQSVAPLTIAITGSYGKTSTKEHLAAMLGSYLTTVASPASWNNQAGLCRTINEFLHDSTEVFIAEMGTYGRGEIRRLCSWVQPSVVAITAIGPVHLERMGSTAGIVAAKTEITEGAEVAILNIDSPELAQQADLLSKHLRVIRCSGTNNTSADVKVYEQNTTKQSCFDYFGEHHTINAINPSVRRSNVAVAAALAAEAGVPTQQLPELIENLNTMHHRAEVIATDSGVTVIDNTYNSNPVGAREDLATLLNHQVGGRLVVVTPGMVELGHLQYEENARFAKLVAESASELLIVGRTNRAALREGTTQGGGSAIEVPDRDAARDWVRQNLGDGDAVLWENDLPDHYP